MAGQSKGLLLEEDREDTAASERENMSREGDLKQMNEQVVERKQA